MDGENSEMFLYFKALLIKGFYELRLHAESLIVLIEIMSKGSKLPCFIGGESAIEELKERLNFCSSEKKCIEKVENMLYYSMGNWRTVLYDNFQNFTNNIFYYPGVADHNKRVFFDIDIRIDVFFKDFYKQFFSCIAVYCLVINKFNEPCEFFAVNFNIVFALVFTAADA